MGIIDCHQHVLLKELFKAQDRGDLDKKISDDLADRQSMMRKNGIESAVLLPSFDYNKSKGIESTKRAMDLLLQYQASDPKSFPWLGCSVEPQHYEAGCNLLSELLASGKFSMVTWHNRFHGLSADSPVMSELVQVAAEHSTPIFLHAAGNLDHEEAWRVARLVKKCPNATFVILDSLMTLASTDVLVGLAEEVDNVWLDIANALPIRRVVEEVGAAIGWDRVVFGSCFYTSSHSFVQCGPLEEFLASPVGGDDRERVLRTNVLALLGDA